MCTSHASPALSQFRCWQQGHTNSKVGFDNCVCGLWILAGDQHLGDISLRSWTSCLTDCAQGRRHIQVLDRSCFQFCAASRGLLNVCVSGTLSLLRSISSRFLCILSTKKPRTMTPLRDSRRAGKWSLILSTELIWYVAHKF